MKSGFPPLKITLALAWTHTHVPPLASSLKTVKPLSPVFITGGKEKSVDKRVQLSQTPTHTLGPAYF